MAETIRYTLELNFMVGKLRLSAVWLGLTLAVLVLFLFIQDQWKAGITQAKLHFIELSHSASVSESAKLETAIRSIYENIRTLASLPNVRSVDRHATNLSPEARVTFQQIYNNLASNVAISEVYIVPLDFTPTKLDPVTLKTEEPILVYDELILNAGSGLSTNNRIANPKAATATPLPAVAESFEYAQLVEHAAWLSKNYPYLQNIKGLKIPFISGSDLITRDNTIYSKTKQNKDRSGLIFSVPFYGPNGKIRGTISAVILSSALRDLLPLQSFALVNPRNKYANLAAGVQSMASSRKFIEAGLIDPDLIYSEVLEFSVKDSKNPWLIWSGLKNEVFWSSADVQALNSAWAKNLSMLAAFTLFAALIAVLADRNLRQATTLANNNIKTRFLAEQAEAEARETAEKFKFLNQDISRLNTELSLKIIELTEAQDDIIRKGKMAQLGSLVATVAHELRNPLGGVRTTAFMLRRKLKNSSFDVDKQLQRIDAGVARCDGIITQLLDFSRSQPLSTSDTDLENWLVEIVTETAHSFPENIEVQIDLQTPGLVVAIESERLRRGLENLLLNAAEVLTGNVGVTLNPKIMITLKETWRGAEISVSDNGPGISLDVIERVGEALFTTKSFGAGLGVAAARKIAELHGGGLDISSALGQGACFTIWLATPLAALKCA